MFGKKLLKGSIELRLNEDQFCSVWEAKASECSHEFCVDTSADQYNLFYRNGQFLGTPTPFGGSIYPFSLDPTTQGKRSHKKQFNRAKVVCLSKDFNLKVFWGTDSPFIFEDSVNHKAYEVGARGVFYVNIDPTDAARKADQFYSKCSTQRNAALFDAEALRDFLREAFIMQIGARIQHYIEEKNRSIANYVGLMPSEILAISEELCPKMKDIFGAYGLTIVTEASSGSILQGLMVKEVVRD